MPGQQSPGQNLTTPGQLDAGGGDDEGFVPAQPHEYADRCDDEASDDASDDCPHAQVRNDDPWAASVIESCSDNVDEEDEQTDSERDRDGQSSEDVAFRGRDDDLLSTLEPAHDGGGREIVGHGRQNTCGRR